MKYFLVTFLIVLAVALIPELAFAQNYTASTAYEISAEEVTVITYTAGVLVFCLGWIAGSLI